MSERLRVTGIAKSYGRTLAVDDVSFAIVAFGALPVLFFATWKTLLFQAVMLAFAAFWTTVDSQYGMIRVAASQPVSRGQYLVGKWIGISGHVVVFTVTWLVCDVMWASVYSGVRGVRVEDWVTLGRFGVKVTVFTVALSIIAAAVASLRRTVGAGIVTALLGVIVLAAMTLLPFDLMSPGWVLMRYFMFPLGEFPNPFPSAEDSPFVRVHSTTDLYAVILVMSVCAVVPALWHFRRREITE